jgi:hypothetical protein
MLFGHGWFRRNGYFQSEKYQCQTKPTDSHIGGYADTNMDADCNANVYANRDTDTDVDSSANQHAFAD